MDKLLEKIDNFLFDIFGLVFPGLLLLCILFSPAIFYNIDDLKSDSMLFSLAKTYEKIGHFESSLKITVALILAYLIGHVVKVFAMLFYELGELIFDNNILQWTRRLNDRLKTRGISIPSMFSGIWKYFERLLKKIFKFKSAPYNEDNHELLQKSIVLINQKTGMNFPTAWYSFYKLSTAIQNQENIKSLTVNYLSKYNFYRSLAFIFAINQLYLVFLFNLLEPLKPHLATLKWNFYFANLFFFFTFHVKYKRYWTLCGNEALVSLFYFLHRDKIKPGN